MILGTIDPNSETAGMLSIPRDLWVSIPGFEENRVNMANFLGESRQYPGGGPALAKKTVEYNLGVPVNYYVRVDFGGFEKLVDTIGGLDIDVEKDIIDDAYPDEAYGYDPLYIPAGRQHMDGKLALKFARTRHGASDFERAKRQQQVLLAIRDKALQLNLLPKLPELMVILADTIETDLQPSDILTLAQAASKVGRDKVKSSFVDESMTLRHVTPTGADVLLPVREKIRPMIDSIFTSSVAMVPVKVTVQVQEVNQLAQDGAKISVMNGTQNMGLAEQTIAYLKKQGYQLAETSQADRTDYPKTIIIDYTGKIYTLEQLRTALNVPSDEIRHSPNLQSGVDIRVILGADLKLPEEE
jgi:LCP family protein required for cell wall assembly